MKQILSERLTGLDALVQHAGNLGAGSPSRLHIRATLRK